jgi:hypothetical protein
MKYFYTTRFYLLFIFLSIFSSQFSFSQTIDQESDSLEFKRFTILFLPVLELDPVMGVGFGLNMPFNFRIDKNKDTRPSNGYLFGLQTIRNQLLLSSSHLVFLSKERYMLEGFIDYRKFPQNFYGIGGRSPQESETLVSYQTFQLRERVLKKLSYKWFLGLQYRYMSVWNVEPLSNEEVINEEFFPDFGEMRSSGLGIHILYDSRDNVLNAKRGNFSELRSDHFGGVLGGNYAYHTISLDVRKFFPLDRLKKHIIATRFYSVFNRGEVPFFDMPQTGNLYSTRGYVLSRYKVRNFASAETEYRFNIWKSIGATTFFNVHSVTETNHQFKYLNPGGGVGLRYKLNKAEDVNVRLDFAFGVDGNHGIYILYAEAF